jgi:hypothetical protein
MTNASTSNRARSPVGNILIYLLGALLVGSAIAKFAQVPNVVSQLGAMGFDGGRLTLIAVLEITSAILFMVPRTRAIGLLLLSAYLGGAIATHLGHGQPPSQPAFVLVLAWLGAWLRHPEILWSLTQSKPSERSLADDSK